MIASSTPSSFGPRRWIAERAGRIEQPPAIEPHHLRAGYPSEKVEVVRRDHDGRAQFVKRFEQVEQAFGHVGIDVAGRLVRDQDFRLVPHLSTWDNIALPLRVAGMPEADIEQPVREMLTWVGLGDRADARPATLSGGEQQRVAIARAVIARPEILVADEPTGNVDPDMAERLLHLFESLNKLGTTVVVATHDFHLLGRIPGAQMMRLDRGRLLDPSGLLRHPPHRPDS